MGDSELEAAARAVVERWALGMTIEGDEIDALAAALAQPPVPLQVGDTVTRDDAARRGRPPVEGGRKGRG